MKDELEKIKEQANNVLWHLLNKKYFYFSKIRNSVLLFLALPSSLEFVEIGIIEPNPFALILLPSIPNSSRVDLTEKARL
jgi:hypothetical protein